MLMASGFVPSQRGKQSWSISTDPPGACELSCELGMHRQSPSRHRCPASVDLPAILQSPRSLNRPRERENWKKLLGFS